MNGGARRLRPAAAIAEQDIYRDVLSGLQRRPRILPPKLFYDAAGSRLFEAICATPEYYLTRIETSILHKFADDIAAQLGRDCILIEPGCGDARKVRILLDAVRPALYVPLDISRDYLKLVAADIKAAYPWLAVRAVCMDFTAPDHALPALPPGHRRHVFFPGSSLGNFDPPEAVRFLRRLRHWITPDGGMLIGIDLKKPPAQLDAAYNDAQGATAAFNLNVLRHINREFGANFVLDRFYHHACYNERAGRIEMYLVCRSDHTVRMRNHTLTFKRGERILTEKSYKYTLTGFKALAAQAGLGVAKVWTDTGALFSVQYLSALAPRHTAALPV